MNNAYDLEVAGFLNHHQFLNAAEEWEVETSLLRPPFQRRLSRHLGLDRQQKPAVERRLRPC